jgi:hypothetical protein
MVTTSVYYFKISTFAPMNMANKHFLRFKKKNSKRRIGKRYITFVKNSYKIFFANRTSSDAKL